MCQFYTNLMAYPYVLLNLNKWSCSLKLEITQVWHDLKKKKNTGFRVGNPRPDHSSTTDSWDETGKWFQLSEPWFPHLKNRGNDTFLVDAIELPWESDGRMVEQLCWAHQAVSIFSPWVGIMIHDKRKQLPP